MKRTVTITSVLAAVIMCCAPATAQTEDDASQSAEARDLEQIAKVKGISVAEATRRKSLIEQAAVLDEQLDGDPNYGGLRIVSTATEFFIDMRFSRAGQAAIERRGLPAGFASALKVSDGAVPRIDANRVRSLIQTAMARANLKGSITRDETTGKLVIRSLAADRIRALLGANADKVELIAQDDPPPPAVVNLEGGRSVTSTRLDGTGSGCTAAFGVSNGSTSGILTGAHCVMTAMNQAFRATTVTTQGATLTSQNARWSTSSDFMWAAGAGHVGTNKMWDGSFSRGITGVNAAAVKVGDTICKLGNVTGYNCASVTNSGKTWTNPDGSVIGPLVELTYDNPSGNIAQCGDSGGPVFYGNVAYGVTSRGDNNGSCKGGAKLWYAEIRNLSSIGVTVLTK